MHACEGGDAVYCVLNAVSLCTGDLRFSYIVDVVMSWCRGVVRGDAKGRWEGRSSTNILPPTPTRVCLHDGRTD